jgi:hypothetical protein
MNSARFVRNSKVSVEPKTLTFTPVNWDEPVPVTVTAFDDLIKEPAVHRTKILHVSSPFDTNVDAAFAGEQAVFVDIEDGDKSGIMAVPEEMSVLEGESISFQFQLQSRPSASVSIEITSSSSLLASSSGCVKVA